MDWNRKAKLYDFVFSLPVIKQGKERESKNFIELFKIAMKESEISHVLDIACGTGKNIEALIRWTCAGRGNEIKIFGIDIAKEMIKKACMNQNKMPCCFAISSAIYLPFKDNAFDFAYSLGLTEYLGKDALKKFFTELNRVLKSRSFVVVSFTPKSYLNLPRYLWGMRFYQRSFEEFISFATGFDFIDMRETEIQNQVLLRKRK